MILPRQKICTKLTKRRAKPLKESRGWFLAWHTKLERQQPSKVPHQTPFEILLSFIVPPKHVAVSAFGVLLVSSHDLLYRTLEIKSQHQPRVYHHEIRIP